MMMRNRPSSSVSALPLFLVALASAAPSCPDGQYPDGNVCVQCPPASFCPVRDRHHIPLLLPLAMSVFFFTR
jgi:hypothetical protein